jgi:hypothetical protein
MNYLCPTEYDFTENTTNLEGKRPNSKQPNHTFASLVPSYQYKFAFFLLIQFFLQEPWAKVEDIVRILLFGPIHIFGVVADFFHACPCKMMHILSLNELNYSLVKKHDYFLYNWMMTNYGYTCYQKIISKSLQSLSPRNIISHHIYKCLRHVPKYILAIQSNKCIPYFNINAVNCEKIQRPKSDESQKFPKSTSSLSKISFNFFRSSSTLLMYIYKVCELFGPKWIWFCWKYCQIWKGQKLNSWQPNHTYSLVQYKLTSLSCLRPLKYIF